MFLLYEWCGKGQRFDHVVYYESIKRDLKRRIIYEYRCDERLKTKSEESIRLADTGLVLELEHLKTKTRLIDEKFASVRGFESVRGECDQPSSRVTPPFFRKKIQTAAKGSQMDGNVRRVQRREE